jgi:hypothetical protein
MGKLRNEKINNLYSSTNIIKVIKSMRIVWAAHEAPECIDLKTLVVKHGEKTQL